MGRFCTGLTLHVRDSLRSAASGNSWEQLLCIGNMRWLSGMSTVFSMLDYPSHLCSIPMPLKCSRIRVAASFALSSVTSNSNNSEQRNLAIVIRVWMLCSTVVSSVIPFPPAMKSFLSCDIIRSSLPLYSQLNRIGTKVQPLDFAACAYSATTSGLPSESDWQSEKLYLCTT